MTRQKQNSGGKKPKAESGDLQTHWTITEAAKLLAVDPKTVAMGLRREGHDVSRGMRYTVKSIVAAVFGDAEKERTEKLQLENQRLRREEDQAAERLFPMADLEQWLVQNYAAPMSNILASAPTTLDTRCNPEHPEIARRVLEDWIEQTVKPALKTGLEKPKSK